MPLVHVTLAEGTTSQDRRAQIGDAIHRALIEVANAPEDDRFQVITEVRPANLVYSPDFMGFDRNDDILVNLVEMPKENGSFGRGELSYPPAALSSNGL